MTGEQSMYMFYSLRSKRRQTTSFTDAIALVSSCECLMKDCCQITCSEKKKCCIARKSLHNNNLAYTNNTPKWHSLRRVDPATTVLAVNANGVITSQKRHRWRVAVVRCKFIHTWGSAAVKGHSGLDIKALRYISTISLWKHQWTCMRILINTAATLGSC